MERDPNHGSSDFIRGPGMGLLQVETIMLRGTTGSHWILENESRSSPLRGRCLGDDPTLTTSSEPSKLPTLNSLSVGFFSDRWLENADRWVPQPQIPAV